MAGETSSNHSNNRCSSIFPYNDYCKDAADLNSRQLSLKGLTSACRQSSASKSSGTSSASKKHGYAPLLHCHLFATILEDVLTQINILGECNNEMRNYKMQFEIHELHDKKYGVMSSVTEDEQYGIDPKNLECDCNKLCKHAADRETCYTVLLNTYQDLALNNSYEALIKHRETVEGQLDHFLFLIDDEAKNKEMKRDLRRQVRQQQIRIKSSVYETNLIVEDLITKLEDAGKIINAQERYVERWENSRSEQNNMCIEDEETKLTSTIDNYHIKADDEQRVHSEIENIIKIKVFDTLREIENCMAKYEKDIEAMDYNITLMKFNYEKQIETRREIEQKLAEQDVEIKKWIQFKEDREKLREYRKKMEAAAIIVQAWWRGLLVRLKLGPFKPSLKKKKRNKKKKK